jgi:hypothetical protein
MRQYQLENPSNARVFINFNNKENPVSFSYPAKENAFNTAFVTIFPLVKYLIPFWFLPLILFIFLHNVMIIWVGLILMVSVSIILPILIITIISTNKRLILLLPKINKWINRRDIKHITIEKLDSNVYEVPIFDNVFLEWFPYGEFGEYLSKIEVTEYDFYYLRRTFFSKKFTKIQNDGYWKVRFIFSEIPKEGRLEIEFI